MRSSVDTRRITDHIPPEDSLREKSVPVLLLVRKLCNALTTENIVYCHWKSNDVLERSASGDNDLDLLVGRADVRRFAELTSRLGFKQAVAPAEKQMPAVRGLDEVAWNRFFLRESLHALRTDPARIVRLAGIKLGRMWNPVPNVDRYGSGAVRAVSAVWTIPTFVLALIGAALLIRGSAPEGWRIAVLLLLPALYLSALHSLFVGSVRYRLGAVPMLEMLAAYALVVLVDRVRKRLATEGYARAV